MGNCKSCISAKNKPTKQTDTENISEMTIKRREDFRQQRSSCINAHSLRDQAHTETLSGTKLGSAKSKTEISFIMKALKKHFLFKSLAKDMLEKLALKMKLYQFSPQSSVYHQGDQGWSMFLLYNGAVKGSNLITNGKIFGEQALVQDISRECTITVLKESTIWRLERSDYVQIVESLNIKNYSKYKAFIGSVPIFHYLTEVQQECLLELLIPKEFKHAEIIIQEGSTGDLFYIVNEGEVKVTKQGREVCRMKKGEFFGEQSLLYDIPRTATITAIGYVRTLALRREALSTVLGDCLANVIYKNSIRIAFEHSKLLSQLSHDQVNSLIDRMEVLSFKKGTTVIEEGSDENLWVILKGKLVNNNTDNDNDFPILTILGEEGLLDPSAFEYTDSLLAGSHVVDVAKIHRDTIEEVLEGDLLSTIELNQRTTVLSTVKLLHSLPHPKLKFFASQMILKEFREGQTIFKKGDDGTEFFIIKEGKVDVRHGAKTIRTLESLNYFGERAIILKEPRTASVIALEATICWVLNQETFLSMINEKIRTLLTKRMLLQNDTIELTDLFMVRKLGSGSFGNVFLTINSRDKTTYALKTISRSKVHSYDLFENVKLERAVLLQLDHPFIVKLVKTFKDEKRIYLLLEYVRGLDFFDVLQRFGKFSELHCRFYVSCILLVMEHLHEKHIVYRDFKPENIIIDEDGYPKLIDFGASKIINGRTFTTIGTPQYMAPEVISGIGYSYSADYWALGVMLYELATGKLPFGNNDSNHLSIYEAVLKGQYDVRGLSDKCKSLVELLLDERPIMRGNAASIKNHEFFHGVEWDSLITKGSISPYTPSLKSINKDITSACNLKNSVWKQINKEEGDNTRGCNPPKCMKNWDDEF